MILLILAMLFTTIAWGVPTYKGDIKWSGLLTSTISKLALGKHRRVFQAGIILAALCLSLYISALKQSLSNVTALVLFISAFLFILIDERRHLLLHSISGGAFFVVLSICPVYLKGFSVFLVLAIAGLLLTCIQLLMRKGNGLGVLLMVYASAFALLS